MYPFAALTRIEKRARKLNVTYDQDDVFKAMTGEPNDEFNDFSLLHNSTVIINGTVYPSVLVILRPEEEESDCNPDQYDFSWEITSFTVDHIKMQIYFDSPECISSSTNVGDILTVTIYDQRLFTSTNNKLVAPEFTFEKRILR